MKNRIITISREFGSGGRTIGKKVAEELGIPCYDSELIEKVASESGFDANYIKDAGEYDNTGKGLKQFCIRTPCFTGGALHHDFQRRQIHFFCMLDTITERLIQWPTAVIAPIGCYHRNKIRVPVDDTGRKVDASIRL